MRMLALLLAALAVCQLNCHGASARRAFLTFSTTPMPTTGIATTGAATTGGATTGMSTTWAATTGVVTSTAWATTAGTTTSWATTLAPTTTPQPTTPPPPPPMCNTSIDNATGIMLVNHSSPVNCSGPLELKCPKVMGMTSQFQPASKRVGHFEKRIIRCAEGHAPTDRAYDVSTWGEEWYTGPNTTTTQCNNGTWMNMSHVNMAVTKPTHLNCATYEQIKLLKKLLWVHKWTGVEYNKTIAHGYSWIDASALYRKTQLEHSRTWAMNFYDDAMSGNFPSVADLKTCIRTMEDNRLVAHGSPFTKDSCSDLERTGAVLQLRGRAAPGMVNYIAPGVNGSIAGGQAMEQAVEFKCQYTQQKSSIGWDFLTASPVMYFRSGCMCTSRWVGGCLHKNNGQFQKFGFAAVEEKVISTSNGAASPNAYCWYWSDPAHPEFGYMYGGGAKNPIADGVTGGVRFQAPAKNGTDLMKAVQEMGGGGGKGGGGPKKLFLVRRIRR